MLPKIIQKKKTRMIKNNYCCRLLAYIIFIIGIFVIILHTSIQTCIILEKSSIICRITRMCSNNLLFCKLLKLSNGEDTTAGYHIENQMGFNVIINTKSQSSTQINNSIMKMVISMGIIVELNELNFNTHIINVLISTKRTYDHSSTIKNIMKKYIKISKNRNMIIKNEYDTYSKYFKYLLLLRPYGYSNKLNLSTKMNFDVDHSMEIIRSNLEDTINHTEFLITDIKNYLQRLIAFETIISNKKTADYINDIANEKELLSEIKRSKLLHNVVCLGVSYLGFINPILLIGSIMCARSNHVIHRSRISNLKTSKEELALISDYIDQTLILIKDHIRNINSVKVIFETQLSRYKTLSATILRTISILANTHDIQYSSYLNYYEAFNKLSN